MRCEKIKSMLADLLDQTLSVQEEREVKEHLALCEGCSSEYLKLKRADDLLRETVCQMMAEIEVPDDLNRKIEKAMDGGRNKKSPESRLTALFIVPAAAAVLLLTIISAAALNYFNFFSPSKQADMALSEPNSGGKNTTQNEDSVIVSREDLARSDSVMEEQDLRIETGDTGASGEPARLTKQAAPSVNDPPGPDSRELLSTESTPVNHPDVDEVDALDKTKTDFPQAFPLEYTPCPPVGHSFKGAGGGDGKGGTLEQAAREVGFYPARPEYLPPGAQLREIRWLSGTVYQNYLIGEQYIEISHRRLEAADIEQVWSAEAIKIEINGMPAALTENPPEAGDDFSRERISVCWRQDQWIFTVSGNITVEEIIKVALFLK